VIFIFKSHIQLTIKQHLSYDVIELHFSSCREVSELSEQTEDGKTSDSESDSNNSKKKQSVNPKCGTCELCIPKKTFESRIALLYHIEIDHAHSPAPEYFCTALGCKEQFLTRTLLSRHAQFTHSENGPNYRPSYNLVCSRICGKSSFFPDELRTHDMEEHADLLKYECLECQSKYFESNLLEAHMETHSSSGMGFRCRICPHLIIFDDPSKLENHIVRLHCIALGTRSRVQKSYKKYQGPKCRWRIPRKPTPSVCEFCGIILQPRDKGRHRNRCKRKGPNKFHCELCSRTYTREERLISHVCKAHETEPTKNPDYTCPKCSKMFVTSIMFKIHVNGHNLEKRLPIVCATCEKRFKDEPSLENHEKQNHAASETPSKPQKSFTCPQCREAFYSTYVLKKHQRDNHPNVFFHTCPECQASFAEAQFLQTHLKTHSPVGPYNCLACKVDKTFISAELLHQHLEVRHTSGPSQKCSECDFVCPHRKGLIVHIARKHGGSWPETCPDCSKGFANKSELDIHIRVKHTPDELKPEASFKCQDCGAQFREKSHFRTHVRTIHERKHLKVCDVCGKVINGLKLLKDHMKIHTEEKNFACEFCDKRFVRRDALRVHTYTHTGEKPFGCHICEKRFNQGTPLKKHIDAHKKNGSWFPKPPPKTDAPSTSTTSKI
jgi:KRAB domain-containing zinc finger protein